MDPATPRSDISSVAYRILSSTSRSSLRLGRDKAYQMKNPQVSAVFTAKIVAKRTHHIRVRLYHPRPHRSHWVLRAPRDCWGNISDAGWRKSPKQKTNQSSERHQPAKLVQIKGLNQSTNSSEEDANKNKTKNKISYVCPLHVPGHNMNLWKITLSQEKGMKLTWFTAHGGGAGCVRFQGANKRPA